MERRTELETETKVDGCYSRRLLTKGMVIGGGRDWTVYESGQGVYLRVFKLTTFDIYEFPFRRRNKC